jgi:hypothetical protein
MNSVGELSALYLELLHVSRSQKLRDYLGWDRRRCFQVSSIVDVVTFLLNRCPCLKLRMTTAGSSTAPAMCYDPCVLLFLLLPQNPVRRKVVYTDSCLRVFSATVVSDDFRSCREQCRSLRSISTISRRHFDNVISSCTIPINHPWYRPKYS